MARTAGKYINSDFVSSVASRQRQLLNTEIRNTSSSPISPLPSPIRIKTNSIPDSQTSFVKTGIAKSAPRQKVYEFDIIQSKYVAPKYIRVPKPSIPSTNTPNITMVQPPRTTVNILSSTQQITSPPKITKSKVTRNTNTNIGAAFVTKPQSSPVNRLKFDAPPKNSRKLNKLIFFAKRAKNKSTNNFTKTAITSVNVLNPPKHSKKSKINNKLLANLPIIVSLPLIAFTAYAGIGYYSATRKFEAPIAAPTEEVLGDTTTVTTADPPAQLAEKSKPSEVKTSNYVYAPKNPTDPKTIKISSIGVFAYILQVKDTKSGAMGVPGGIYDVGWYTKTPSPGAEKGLTVMNGHVYGPTKPAVFANLKKVKPGDKIEITLFNNTKITYQVVKSTVYKAGEALGDLQSSVSSKQGLNLVTCTGAIKGDEYQDRLVVFSERI